LDHSRLACRFVGATGFAEKIVWLLDRHDERRKSQLVRPQENLSTSACSNSMRENNCNVWLKLLDTRVTAVVVVPMVHVSFHKP